MVGKVSFSLFAVFLLVSAVFLVSVPFEARAVNTVLYIDPPAKSGLSVGDTFKVNVSVANVVDLYAWQFSLYYRGDVLNLTAVEEGPFLLTHPDAQTLFVAPIMTDTYNATFGLLIVADTLSAVQGGVNGSGTLAVVTFKLKAASSSIVHLTDEKLVDSHQPFGNLISHTLQDGFVYSGARDVAVVSLAVSPSTVFVGQAVRVDVTVLNNGTSTETFNVTAYYNSSVIGVRSVTGLAAGSGLNVTFSWDTTGVVPDSTYVVRAEAGSVPGEVNLSNNVLVDGSVLVRSYVLHVIAIADVVPCNQSGYAASSFAVGSLGYFRVRVNNTSVDSETVLVTVNVYDVSNTTLGVVSFKGSVLSGISTFILGLPISSTASRGTAMVYADAYANWPYYGGVPLSAEVSASFQIVNP